MSSESAHLTDNIRHLREVRGLSQAQIAQLAGIPRATWTHLESGAANQTLNVLVKVANALQVRLEELLSPARSPVLQVKVANLGSRRRGEVTLLVRTSPDDMGRLIGRRGRVIQALRQVVRAAGSAEGVKANVDVLE